MKGNGITINPAGDGCSTGVEFPKEVAHMRKLRFSAIFLLATLSSLGWAQTSSTQEAPGSQSQKKSQHHPNTVDPGIRIDSTTLGAPMCGSIVSYNFSQ